MGSPGTFVVARWLAAHPPSSCGAVHVSQPQLMVVWSKAAAAAASGGVSGGGSERKYSYGDATGLLPFSPPRLPASLDSVNYMPKDEGEDVGVEAVVRAAAAALGRGARLGDACEVLAYRNNFNKLLGTAFDHRATWTIDACLLPRAGSSGAAGGSSNTGGSGSTAGSGSTGSSSGASSLPEGVLFLDIVKDGQEGWRGDPADRERFTRWGYAFEALCTGQTVADPSSEFGVLLRTRLAAHRVLLGAEVDCYDPQQAQQAGQDAQQAGQARAPPSQQEHAAPAPSLGSFLELKTYRQPSHPRQQRTIYQHKHPKWWLQSFLAGVPRLALGARDDQGFIQRIDTVPTADLPRISASHGVGFSPNQALLFGCEALGWMRREAAARPGQHLRFSYAGGDMCGGGGSGGGSGSSAIACDVLAEGRLPQRLQQCLAACGLAV